MCPVFLKIGNFIIYWYGVMVAVGVLVSSLFFQFIARKKGYSDDFTSKLIFLLLLAGFLGARLVHVAVNFQYYFRHPLEVFLFRNGGLAVQGGILVGFFSLWIFLRLKKANIREIFDLVALALPIGQVFGRVGCFLNGCCHGRKTDAWYGVQFPFLPHTVHPLQLYYALGDCIIFLFLLLFFHEDHYDGEIAGWYLIFFGALRYSLDFLRGDLVGNGIGLYSTQLFANFLFFIGAYWIFRISVMKR
ncbi:MAG: prolipoprotein diacylglyceryl transferase [Candidatus Ratteibacteria bacterium]|jgi:phosphatidylglycerol:prolipoprotein diacylglycerol transferase